MHTLIQQITHKDQSLDGKASSPSKSKSTSQLARTQHARVPKIKAGCHHSFRT
jgi:hypothetical protein